MHSTITIVLIPVFQYLKQDKWLSKKIEEQLVGVYCCAKVERNKDIGRKTKKFQFLYTDQLNMVDLIKATTDDINFDPSIL